MLIFLPIALLVLAFVWLKATPYMFVATLSYLFLVCGLYLREQRSKHYKLMTVGILIDLGIVLTLELQRHAVETAVSFSLTPIQQAHIGFSTVATILYFPVLYLGYSLLRSWSLSKRTWHIRLALTAFIFRTLGFITMFTLLSKKTV